MSESAIITTNNVNLWYNEKRALESVSMTIPKNKAVSYTHLTLPTNREV